MVLVTGLEGSLQPSLQREPSELQSNLEELKSIVGKCEWRRLECIIFVIEEEK